MEEKAYRYLFSVLGMSCAMCARKVEKALKGIEGVVFASVNLATATAFVLANREISFEEIEKAVSAVGYNAVKEKGEDLESRKYSEAKKNVIFAWIFSSPLIFSMFYHMFGGHLRVLPLFEIVAATLVIFFAGRNTLKGAWIAITHGHFNADTLISIGSLSSYSTIFLNLFFPSSMESFGTVGAMIVAVHLTGRYVEARLRNKAFKEVKELLKLKPREARVVLEEGELLVPIEAVKEGSLISVKPSEIVPADGEIVDGASYVDESIVSGESIPKLKRRGDKVVSGSKVVSAPLNIRVEKVGKDSFISQVIELVQEACGSKVPIQVLVDKVSNVFVPIVLGVAVFSFVLWAVFLGAPPVHAFKVLISTLVIACPCALGLAIPMALAKGVVEMARRGVLVKNAEVVQTSLDVRVALFDKTGTLTKGLLRVVEHNLDEHTLKVVATMGNLSNHPVARALSNLTPDRVSLEEFVEEVGEGMKALHMGEEYFVGKPRDSKLYDESFEEGKIIVEVRKNGEVLGFLSLQDELREDAKEAVDRLRRMGIKPVLLSGDDFRIVSKVAEELGINEFFAGAKPKEKLEVVRNYQASGFKVVMVGDGMNDAAALKGADIGVAMGEGTEIAIDSADVVVLSGGIARVADFLEISRAMYDRFKQNLFWAFLYNGIAIPLAVMRMVNPILAETLMALSSISVTLNSTRTLKFKCTRV